MLNNDVACKTSDTGMRESRPQRPLLQPLRMEATVSDEAPDTVKEERFFQFTPRNKGLSKAEVTLAFGVLIT